MTTAYGPVREVMFAPTSDVTDVNTFLIRDDAYARSSAVLGRTLRLGDPIDTGAVSAAYQTTWSGGRDQTIFNDTSMFLDSTLDTTDPSGRLKMWMGFEPLGYGGVEYSTSIISALSGTSFSNNSILFCNTDNVNTSVYRRLVDTPYTQTNISTFYGEVGTAMCALDQTGGIAQSYTAIGFSNGSFKVIDNHTGTATDRTTSVVADRAYIYDIVPYNRKMAVLMGHKLFTVDTNSGGITTWTEIVAFNQAISPSGGAASLAVVGSTLYILIQYRGGRAALFASDGSSGATLLHIFENSYPVKLHAFKGGLYIHMNETAFTQTVPTQGKLNSVLYSYTGGSMRRLHSRNNSFQYFVSAVSSGPSCIWNDYIAISYYSLPKALSSTEDRTVGVLLYDPVNDSFHMGPSMKGLPAGTVVKAMGQSNGSLYMNIYDGTNNVLCSTRRDEIVCKWGWSAAIPISSGIRATQQKHSLISSAFDAGLPDQQKTWLRVNVKHNLETDAGGPYMPTMNVYVRTSSNDYDSTQYLIGTYNPPLGVKGWRTTSFDIAWTGTKFPKSNQLRYVIELTYPHNPSNPEYGAVLRDEVMIDSVSVEYMLVATPKKVWRSRVLFEDDQLDLNGDAMF